MYSYHVQQNQTPKTKRHIENQTEFQAKCAKHYFQTFSKKKKKINRISVVIVSIIEHD